MPVKIRNITSLNLLTAFGLAVAFCAILVFFHAYKPQPQEEWLPLRKIYFYDFEEAEPMEGYTPTPEYVHRGRHGALLQGPNAYGFSLTYRAGDIMPDSIMNMKTEYQLYAKSDTFVLTQIVEHMRGDKIMNWSGQDFQGGKFHDPNKWSHVSSRFWFPKNPLPDDIIHMYFWIKSADFVVMDDLEVTFTAEEVRKPATADCDLVNGDCPECGIGVKPEAADTMEVVQDAGGEDE